MKAGFLDAIMRTQVRNTTPSDASYSLLCVTSCSLRLLNIMHMPPTCRLHSNITRPTPTSSSARAMPWCVFASPLVLNLFRRAM